MKCAHCLEEMNEGATVCKVCAREQPPSAEEASRRFDHRVGYVLLAVLAAVVIGATTYLGLDSAAKNKALERAAFAAKFCNSGVPEVLVKDAVVTFHSQGLSWERAADAERLMTCPGLAAGD